MKHGNFGHGGPGSGGHDTIMSNGQRLALWLAILIVCTSIGFIWQAALWITDNILYEQIDNSDVIYFAPFVLTGVIAMIALYSARMGTSSSIALGLIWVLSKSPIW